MVEAGSDEDSRDVLVRLVPPMFVLNELPLALEVSAPESGLNRPCRLEAGARSALHGLVTAQSHRVQLQVRVYIVCVQLHVLCMLYAYVCVQVRASCTLL
jgi:hypothetical protein